MLSYKNDTTQEVVTVESWRALETIKARSIAKGHRWYQLRQVATTTDSEGRVVPVNVRLLPKK